MKDNFRKKILNNGLTILFEKRSIPVVSLAFAVRAGGVNESVSEKGVSHFIEHMLYKGTNRRGAKQIAEEIEKNGGELNGFTGDEITAYWCKMPSEKLEIALDVLSDMVKNPKFDKDELEKERKVIFEEIKMIHDNPIKYCFDEIQKSLYTGTMEISLIGTNETMNSITREKIVEKFMEIYNPNNLILCIVGDADFEEIVSFCEKNFGEQKGEVPIQKFSLKNEDRTEERRGIDQANLIFAYHVQTAKDKKNYAAQILSSLMAGGMSSRLFTEIREKRNLAYAVKGDSSINRDFAYNIIYVGTMKENIGEVKKLILEEFKKVAGGLDEKELNEIKQQLIGQYKISMEDSQVQMVNLLDSEISGDAMEFYEYEENILNVKLEDVKELAKKAKEKYSFFALLPKE